MRMRKRITRLMLSVMICTALGGCGDTAKEAKEEQKEEMAIPVEEYAGVYTAEKFIDAMGCDVRISLMVREDGSFSFFRYPMNVALEGGGAMESMMDAGTYKEEGEKLAFQPETLKEFALTVKENDKKVLLSGSTPTGGAPTDMEFVKAVKEDREESGVYAGTGETLSGLTVSYNLEMTDGAYTLMQDGAVISRGTYYFTETEAEFFAEEGMCFHAGYDADRQVVEGTMIPAVEGEGYTEIAATLEKQ